MSLEVSNYAIKAIVAEYVNMKLNVLARTQRELDQDNLSAESCKEAIIKVKNEITSLVGYEIRNIILIMPSGHCRKYSDKYRVDAKSADQVITKDEITEGLDGLVKKNDDAEWLVANVTIDKYSAYGYGYVSNPVGLETRYIELEASIYVIPTSIAYPLISIVEESGFNIVDVCLDTLALTTEAVSPNTLQQGVVMIDLNHDSTNIAYFKDHTMKAYSMVEIGAKHITNDLALCAQIDLAKAESFKKKYVSLDKRDHSDLIVYRYYDEYNNEQVEITQKFLSEVAQFRMDELIRLINAELDELRLTNDEIVYVCGGGNRLGGLDEYLQANLKYPYRLYHPNTLGVRNSGYTKCLGAISYEALYSRIKGEIKLFVNQKEYYESISLVEKNNLLYNNNDRAENNGFINRLISYIFNN